MPGKGMAFTRMGPDRFLLTFQHRMDKRHILEGGPWNFENYLIIFGDIGPNDDPAIMDLNFYDFTVWIHGFSPAQFTLTLGRLIGGKVGIVKDVFPLNGMSPSPALKVRLSLDVRKPLLRGTKIRSVEGKEMTVTFSYERLGIFCYLCGIIGHMAKHCDLQYAEDFHDPGMNTPYGPWLWAVSRPRGSFLSSSICSARPPSSLRGRHIFGGFSSPSVYVSRPLNEAVSPVPGTGLADCGLFVSQSPVLPSVVLLLWPVILL
ncbi:hypothetical protein Salat_2493100 [Sesamum alatum]|uniref:CCHC-type domain-containing protein n=1 Tax=Sesamum alatum TaxID=300844 RepID=A0AAE2CC53_9LAMI|nr:hypothetical protein Salat_2493100 [Sesamum alatum]